MCGRNGLVMSCGENYVRPQWPSDVVRWKLCAAARDLMNINEANDMHRRTRENFRKPSETASPTGKFTALMLFCAVGS